MKILGKLVKTFSYAGKSIIRKLRKAFAETREKWGKEGRWRKISRKLGKNFSRSYGRFFRSLN